MRPSPTRLLPYVLALVLGAGAAALTACGSTSKALIPANDAETLKGDLDQVNNLIGSGKCDAIDRALSQAGTDIDELPSNVSNRLVARLKEGVARLEAQAPKDCAAQTQTETIDTTTTAVTTDTTPTTTTATTTTPTVPTTTTDTTTTTTPTTPATTTSTNDTGGVGPVTTP